MNAEATRLLKILSEPNLAIRAVVDMSGNRVSLKQTAPVTTAELISIPTPERSTGMKQMDATYVARNERKQYMLTLNDADERVFQQLSEKFEDIQWYVAQIDKDTEDVVGKGYLLAGERDGERKEFVILEKMDEKEKFELGNAIGNHLYELAKDS